jgi:hypothetical protein
MANDADAIKLKVEAARDVLKGARRKAHEAHTKARIELDLLFELEAMLNLDAISDAISAPTAPTPGDSA